MADDNMELCPARYGEDFDFDFDLTAPLEDEDTIIEDIISTEYSVTSQAGYSPMNDDNNKSVKEFDDIEALTDNKNSKSDYDGMPSRNGNDSNLEVIQKTSELDCDQPYQGNVWSSHPEDCVDEAADNDEIKEEMWDNEEKITTDSKSNFKQQLHTSPHNDNDSRNHLPMKQFEGAIKASSAQFLNVGDVTGSFDRNESSKKTNSLVPSSPNDSSNFLFRSETAGENSDLSDVIVVYQQNEYLLFSTSEFDDPNTFFIKDRTMAQKPLCDFFWAIRNVIHEDLEYESELWLFFPEFDLQIEETSSLLQNVTLLELVTLRKNLLLNDGIDIIQPMYIDLGIRKNFFKELTRITKNANEGKGLSESIIWNEAYEGYEDQKGSVVIEGGSSSAFENESVHNKSTIDELLEEKNSRHEIENINDFDLEGNEEDIRSSEKVFKYESEQDQEFQNKLGIFNAGETGAGRDTHESGPSTAFRNENLSYSRQKTNGSVSISFYDAESDIIDYSEDDLEDRRKQVTMKTSMIDDRNIKPYWNNKTKTKNMSTEYDEDTTIMNFNEEINTHTSEQYVEENNINQENNPGSLSEPIAHQIKHVDIQNEDNQVNFNLNSVELDVMGENYDKREISSICVNSTQDTGRTRENLTYFRNLNLPIRDFPIRYKSNISHKTIDSRLEPSTTVDFMENNKPSVNPKILSDRSTKDLLVDTFQEQDIEDIHSSDKLENEVENEINYEEDEEDEDFAYKKHLSPKSIRQSPNKFPLSTIGKRSRVDCKLEATMEKRDKKRNRS